MHYKSKYGSHFVKITTDYIVKIFSDSIIIHKSPSCAYRSDKIECKLEGVPIDQNTFDTEFEKTLETITTINFNQKPTQ